jgi:chromosome segregation ATPase
MKFLPAFLLLGFFTSITHAEDAPPDPSAKLRDQLRSVTLQVRTAQSDVANAQALKAAEEQKNLQLAAEIKSLKAKNETLVKQSNNDKVRLEESIATLSNKVAMQDKQTKQLDEALVKWKAGYQKAAEVARTKEAERAKVAAEIISVKHTIADRERKNIGLFNTAMEILDRYEGYALGKSLAAREPFVGTTRVKVENMVQGYKDKIIDHRISAVKP